ncbi:P-loop NTPase fold protein [Bengtsoniella intestinalis]|uniref:KAP family P-loop NTPase fold protein n=1 Tax=Bengtsoniella intestinalis TaxID=3073143 RepID=UPI00391F3335
MESTTNKPPLDVLDRQRLLKQVMDLMHLISQNNGSYTFSLNGEWGAGKSFFLDMLETDLRNYQAGKQYLVCHYNCWQYDYYEEPLVAIVAAIMDDINAQTELLSPEVQKAMKAVLAQLKHVAKTVALDVFKNKTGFNLEDYLTETEAQSNFDVHLDFKKAIQETRAKLEALSKQQTLVIVVDELDRCLPNYAIQVLERLHHLFFGLENCIVILAVDQKQLNHTVAQIFGEDVDTEAYLKKFVNFEIMLNKGAVNQSALEKYSTYLDLFDASLIPESKFSIEEFFNCVFSGIDIRTQERIIERLQLVHTMLFPEEKKDYSFMCFEVLWIVLSEVHGYTNNPPFHIGRTFRMGILSHPKKQVSDKLTKHISAYVKLKEIQGYLIPDPIEGNEIPELIVSYYSGIVTNFSKFKINHPITSESGTELNVDENIAQLQKFIKLLSIIK